MSLSFHIKYTNLLTLHFQQAASHLQNAKYLLYCCENKSVDVSERVRYNILLNATISKGVLAILLSELCLNPMY